MQSHKNADGITVNSKQEPSRVGHKEAQKSAKTESGLKDADSSDGGPKLFVRETGGGNGVQFGVAAPGFGNITIGGGSMAEFAHQCSYYEH